MRKPAILLTVAGCAALGAFATWKVASQFGVSKFRSPSAVSQAPDRLSRVQNRESALSERLKAAREISTDLTNQELKEIIAFLSKPMEHEGSETELMAMNETMDQLRVSGMACGEYATALCGLIREPGTHPVVRDYAMQHAVQWMREARHGNAPAKLEDADRKRMLDCIVIYLQSPACRFETGFGTALNLVRTFAPEYPQDSAEILSLCSPRIMEISSGKESAPLGNRVAAIQSLASIPDRERAQEVVRGMVTSSQPDSPVRLVAIAALGSLGNEDDLVMLRKIQEEDQSLAYAARSAADRLESTLAVAK